MKTPDEIKRRLASAIPFHLHPGDPEPRMTPRKLLELEELMADSLAFIQQLEAENAALLRDLCEANRVDCMHCRHYRDVLLPCSCDCDTCEVEDCACKDCRGNSNWEWRGVQSPKEVLE